MIELKRLGIDTSKHVFTLHGVDAGDRPVLRRELRRGRLEAFLAGLAPTEVVLEACGGSHHWGRRALALGHRVRLIPPQYVKPFVKRGKNDRIDAEAIAEAAARPGMAEVAVKSAEAQAQGMLLKMRELLVKQRTQLANALRGHAAEYGLVAAQGMSQVEPLLAAVAADPAIPPLAKAVLARLGQQVAHLDAEIATLDAELRCAGFICCNDPEEGASLGRGWRLVAVPVGAAWTWRRSSQPFSAWRTTSSAI